VKNKDKRPYKKPTLIEIGKHQIDKEAFEKGDLGESKDEVLRIVKEQQNKERDRPAE
jgi:hypothetical protein